MKRNSSLYDRGNIYLSGGMEHAPDGGVQWRVDAAERLMDINYFPIDIAAMDELYRQHHGEVFFDYGDDDERRCDLKKKARIRKHFVEADLQLIINDSQALVVYYDESVRKGAGTISECQVAFMHDIPVFIVSYWEDWKNNVPGWLHAISTKIFTSFEDLYQYLDRLPEGILKKDQYGNHRSDDYYLCSLSGEPFKKTKSHFVSEISPLYSNESVEIVKEAHEEIQDRYVFFKQILDQRR